jgi:hypothetical protein
MNQIEIVVWRQSCHLFAPGIPNASLNLRELGQMYQEGKLPALAECIGLRRLVHKLMQKLP